MSTLQKRLSDLEGGRRELPSDIRDWTDDDLESNLCRGLGIEWRTLTDDELRAAADADRGTP